MLVEDLPIREYNVEDSRMFQHLEVMYNEFLKYQAQFASHFPELDVAWAQSFADDLEEARQLISLNSVSPPTVNQTSLIHEKMAEGADKLRILFRYVDIAWGDKQKSKGFGKGMLGRALGSPERMSALLERAHGQADEAQNRAVLTAKGFGEAQIAALETARGELESLLEERRMMEAARLNATRARIESMNRCYGRARLLNKAAPVALAGSPTEQALFRLTPKRKPGPKKGAKGKERPEEGGEGPGGVFEVGV